tara:strand:+ start:786 stop:1331 length:546 start_codon:yes stop_codon:yes gene_type:complete
MFSYICQVLTFKIFKFKVKGNFPINKKLIVLVFPHTSNWDFIIAIGVRTFLCKEINFVIKKEYYNFLTTNFFNSLGGRPIDRNGNMNSVEKISEMFKNNEIFRIAIAPEGTRKLVDNWKTGFYHIALKANCKILPVAFDWKKREVKIFEVFTPTNNFTNDLKFLKSLFKGVKGKIPENSNL